MDGKITKPKFFTITQLRDIYLYAYAILYYKYCWQVTDGNILRFSEREHNLRSSVGYEMTKEIYDILEPYAKNGWYSAKQSSRGKNMSYNIAFEEMLECMAKYTNTDISIWA